MKPKLILSIAIAITTGGITGGAFVSGNAFAIGRLASIDLYDRTEQRTLPVYWHQGKAWVAGAPGNEYQITVRNTAGQDVLAIVSVDGVNVVSGETASTRQSGYVIDAWQQMDIAGWRKDLSRTAAFYFTSLGDSYAARTGRPNHVGVIGAALYRRKPDPVSYLPEMSAPLASGSVAREGNSRFERDDRGAAATQSAPAPAREKSLADRLGTGHGRSEASPARTTQFERATAQPEEIISIYYDSYANLVARGVIRPQSWREPQPFPGRFVPDPPR